MKPVLIVADSDLFVAEDMVQIIMSVAPTAEVIQMPALDDGILGDLREHEVYGVFAGGRLARMLSPEMVLEIVSRDIGLARIGDIDSFFRVNSPWDRALQGPFTNETIVEVLRDWDGLRPFLQRPAHGNAN